MCRRAPSPESPRSYAPLQPQRTSLFPADLATPPVLPDQLVELLKGYNKEHEHVKLHILAKRPALVLPVVVRYTIRDVAIVYLTLNSDGTQLIVENATAFGPREQVGGIVARFATCAYVPCRSRITPSPTSMCTRGYHNRSRRRYNLTRKCPCVKSWCVNLHHSCIVHLISSRTCSLLMLICSSRNVSPAGGYCQRKHISPL